jgi:hypothetical protein
VRDKSKGSEHVAGNRTKIVIALVALVLTAGAAGGYYLFKKKQQEIYSAALKGLILGQSYGKMVARSDCVPALPMQYSSCRDTVCTVSAHGFIAGCLDAARDDNFCKTVPSMEDTTSSIDWAAKTCGDLKLGDTKCDQYIHKVLLVCYEKNTGKRLDSTDAFKSGFKRGFVEGFKRNFDALK